MSNPTNTNPEWIEPYPADCIATDEPRCPHCGYEMQDVCDAYGTHFQYDDDTIEVECDRCERTFEIVLHVSHSFTTKAVQ